MARYDKSVEIDVPVRTAYNQWTQFEEFPRFMDGVEEVTQLDDARLHWVADIGGQRREWYAKITEQIPDQRIAWRSEEGKMNAGTVTFESIDANKTRVNLMMEYEPEGVAENVGDALGFVSRQVDGDLDRFKEFIESRGVETGSWRGTIS
jgi:uncharacterized membrane protein